LNEWLELLLGILLACIGGGLTGFAIWKYWEYLMPVILGVVGIIVLLVGAIFLMIGVSDIKSKREEMAEEAEGGSGQ